MKLATLKDGSRDGKLAVVSQDLTRFSDASFLAPTLQAALDDWARIAPHLATLAESLEGGAVPSERFHEHAAQSPLPRAYQRLGGVGSSTFLAPREPIRIADEDLDADMRTQIAVIIDDVAMGADLDTARQAIRLVMLGNDISLRGLVPDEPEKAVGLFQSNPYSTFSPVAVTPDELGKAWDSGKISLPPCVDLNGRRFGKADADADTAFDFPSLIVQAARTRPLCPGTIVGSGAGAVSNVAPKPPFLRFGDTVRIEMKDEAGRSIFGAIEQTLQKAERA